MKPLHKGFQGCIEPELRSLFDFITAIDKPRGASPRLDYEDGIISMYLIFIVYIGNIIEKGGERSGGYGLIERF